MQMSLSQDVRTMDLTGFPAPFIFMGNWLQARTRSPNNANESVRLRRAGPRAPASSNAAPRPT